MQLRRWTKHFRDSYNLVYPSCLDGMHSLTPYECYQQLGMGESAERAAYIARRMHYEDETSEGSVKFAASRDCVIYTNRPPSCFVPYEVPPASSKVIDVDNPIPDPRMSREEIWELLTMAERNELFRLHYEVVQSTKRAKLNSVMESNWYMDCIKSLTGGLAAIKQNLRYNQKRSAIDTFLQTAYENISPALKKQKCSSMHLEGIDVKELFADFA